MQVLPAELGAADPIPTATPGRSPAAPSQFRSTAVRWQHRPLLELEQGRNCTSQPILLLQTAARQAKAVQKDRPPEQGEEDGLGRDLRHGAGAAALSLSQCPSRQHPALGMLTLQQSCCLPPACRASLPQPFWGPWLVSPSHHLAGVGNGVSPVRCLHGAPQGAEALWWDGRLLLLLERLGVEAGAGRGGSTGCMWAVSCQRDQQAFGSGWHSAG